ncbi:MAG: hypothetical protein ACTS3F_03945 [Phycisphaerales bacterium]
MLSALVSDGAIWFSVPALLGTGYLLVSLILDQTTGGDVDLDVGGGDGGVSGAEVRILSLQTAAAFCVGAGWMGLAALRLAGMDFTPSAFVGLFSGFGVAWLFFAVMRWLFGLQSSGNISIGDAVDRTGMVSVVVPPVNEGRGRVAIVVRRRRREFDAVQGGSDPIRTNASVRVVGVDRQTNTVTVVPM